MSDWRETAYLRKSDWPEAIPGMGPKREYGPYPWGPKEYDDPNGVDPFPACHPDAASISYEHGGDVCPYCGVPLSNREELVRSDGERGEIWDLARDDVTVAVYHPKCWNERQAEIHGLENRTLKDYDRTY